MKFSLAIACDNAAFCCDSGTSDVQANVDAMRQETARILRSLADKIADGRPMPQILSDVNGNRVGVARFIRS